MGGYAAPALTSQRICRAALELIDAEGVEVFTLQRLARDLGVRAPSLYNHVGSKAEIVEGVRDLVVAEMDYAVFGTSTWDVALQHWARSYRAAFTAHPNTVALLFMTPISAPGTFGMYEVVARSLSRAGWPDHLLIPVIASVEYLIAGSVLDRSAFGDMFQAASLHGAATVARSLASQTSHVAAADRTFELGLTHLVNGLRAELGALLSQEVACS